MEQEQKEKQKEKDDMSLLPTVAPTNADIETGNTRQCGRSLNNDLSFVMCIEQALLVIQH